MSNKLNRDIKTFFTTTRLIILKFSKKNKKNLPKMLQICSFFLHAPCSLLQETLFQFSNTAHWLVDSGFVLRSEFWLADSAPMLACDWSSRAEWLAVGQHSVQTGSSQTNLCTSGYSQRKYFILCNVHMLKKFCQFFLSMHCYLKMDKTSWR